jgi:hypothetical protein
MEEEEEELQPEPVLEVPPQDQEDTSVHPLDAGRKVNTLSKAKQAGLNLSAQKKARRRLRTLVKKLDVVPQEEWEGLIIAAIVEDVDIYHYINAVSLYAALAEAGTSEEMADSIVEGLRANEVVPDDLPYTAEDLGGSK